MKVGAPLLFDYLHTCPGEEEAEEDRLEGDPNEGPTVDEWKLFLNITVDDERNHQRETTPLLAAQFGGIRSILNALLEAGASADVTDGAGVTAVMHALQQGNDQSVQEVRLAPIITKLGILTLFCVTASTPGNSQRR